VNLECGGLGKPRGRLRRLFGGEVKGKISRRII
jgi:hypothetical protein